MPSTKLIKLAETMPRCAEFTEVQKDNLKELVKSVDINAQNDRGQSALIKAVKMGNYELAAYLIELGADKEIKDKEGKTAADYFKMDIQKLSKL
jgi:ankyrin repeat protein